MPLYDYICKKCGHKDDVLLSRPEEENRVVECPECHEEQYERQFPAPTFKFDGVLINP